MKTQSTLRLRVQDLSEAQIQKQIVNALRVRGWLVVRINGLARKEKRRFISSYIIYGLMARSGFPDVVALRGDGRGSGRFLLIEAKDRKGKLSPAQRRFHEFAARFKIRIHVCRSGAEAALLAEELEERLRRQKFAEAQHPARLTSTLQNS